MRLAAHFTAWWLLFSVLTLGLSRYQSTHWCDLPGWAGPDIFEYNRPRPAPRSEVDDKKVTVGYVALRQTPTGHRLPTDTGTQNSGRRGCG